MLYLISLGLDHKDLSLKGLEIAKKCDVLYLENYTSIGASIGDISELTGKKIKLADRRLVENDSNEFLMEAKEKDVGLFIYGNALTATTHLSLLMEAKKIGIDYDIISGISVFDAVGETGLSLYNFGKIVSIPLENNNINTPYDIFLDNLDKGMHTLFLLDLNSNEELTISGALKYLIDKGMESSKLCVGCARLGTGSKMIKVGNADMLMKIDFGRPPYCLVIPGKLQFFEEEYLNTLR